MDLHVLTHSSPTRRSSELETSRKRGYRLIAKVLFPDDYRRAPTLAGPGTHGNPYVGLTAFDDQHAEVFFGRSRMTAKLLTALRRQIDSQRRFVLLVGASGCGKTSLLRAGAEPLLKRGGGRSEEHTSELQSLMRISYAVFCLKKNKRKETTNKR